MYYNCEIWLQPNLNQASKNLIMSASAMALKTIENVSDLRISFENLHRIQKRATPTQMMKYRLALQLHKLYNSVNYSEDWLNLNFQQNFNSRSNQVKIIDQSRLRIGKNIIKVYVALFALLCFASHLLKSVARINNKSEIDPNLN